MIDEFGIDTGTMTQIGKAISNGASTLEEQTNSLNSKIDDTAKGLPFYVYEKLIVDFFIPLKAQTDYSIEIQKRIGMLLQEVAKAVEQEEQQLTQGFQITQNQG